MVNVRVHEGWLEGQRLDFVTGEGQYYSFKGIPYAAPPVGALRFKAPQPPPSWSNIRKCTEHGPKCIQYDIFTNTYTQGSEDCLYLNVYSPCLTPKTPLPVMFYIHGGGFKSGSGDDEDYGPDFLVSHGVVLVTINYRLDLLGFLCLDTKEVPGNAALKDQTAALTWVHENIRNFGGDPKNVTVFGQSAGGSSTMLHMISPLSKGLFNRVIPMSGSPLCDWSIASEPRRRAFKVGKLLGLDTKDPDELLEFLQKLPIEKLINVQAFVISPERHMGIHKFYNFLPVIEKDFGQDRFVPDHPIQMLKKKKFNDVDMFVGYTNGEMTFLIEVFKDLLDQHINFPEMFVPRTISNKISPEQTLKLGDLIEEYYLNNKTDLLRSFTDCLSDATIVFGVHRFIRRLLPVLKSKIYFYKFCGVGNRNVYGKRAAKYGINLASHLDDLMYLFDAKKYNLKIDKKSDEYKMIQLTCTVFTNFAKFGNPTPDDSLGIKWPEYDEEQRYLSITQNLRPYSAPDKETVEFWKSIYDRAGVEF